MRAPGHPEARSLVGVCVAFSLITGLWLVMKTDVVKARAPSMPRFISARPSPTARRAPSLGAAAESPQSVALSGWRKDFLPGIFVVLALAAIYFAAYRDWLDRGILFFAGAAVVTYCGRYLEFYDWPAALRSLTGKGEVFCFLLGMYTLTVVLSEAGLFEHLAKRITLATRGDAWRIMAYFCLLTYTVSLLVNNLAAMLALIPMILSLGRCLRMNPRIFLIGMVVASNLGGASTMVGDFPNMLIASQTGIAFHDFIVYMMPVCFLQLLALLAYLRFTQKELFASRPVAANGAFREERTGGVFEGLRKRLEQDIRTGVKNPKAVRRALGLLAVLFTGFLFSDWLHLRPSVLALGGGAAALFFCGIRPLAVLKQINIRDLLFFAGLFVLAGAVEASGMLQGIGEIVAHLSFGSTLLRCLLLMWLAALVTAFLNAGPSAAFFLPLVVHLNTPAPHYLYWWALSLGVLAGSSATLSGATAGSVAANMLRAARPRAGRRGEEWSLSFMEYARVGVPLGLIFLGISSLYVIAIYRYV